MIHLNGIRRVGPNRISYSAGVAASLVAEAVFIMMVMLVGWLRGKDPWMVTRVPGSFLLGPDAVQPPGFVPGDVLIGLLMHLWLGILVGVVYAAFLPRLRISPMAGGLLAGVVLYALGFWTLPLLFPGRLSPFWFPPVGRALQAVAHVVYGVVFGWTFGTLAKRRT